MNSDSISVTVTATGTAYNDRTRVKGIYYVSAAGGPGSIVLRDGGSGGAIKLDLATVASSVENFPITENGILFGTNCHVTLTNITSLTLILG